MVLAIEQRYSQYCINDKEIKTFKLNGHPYQTLFIKSMRSNPAGEALSLLFLASSAANPPVLLFLDRFLPDESALGLTGLLTDGISDTTGDADGVDVMLGRVPVGS